MMKLVLHRCSFDSLSNTWTQALKNRVHEKLVKVGTKGGVSGMMKHHSALSCKILENITACSQVHLRQALVNVLKCLFCPTYSRARHIVESALLGLSNLVDIPEEAPVLPSAPYLPATDKALTLILDLDETLVHYVENGSESHLNVRPGCNDFLVEMSKYYELVIFTAALQDYADWAIDMIDSQKSISFRLYRQHTIPTGSVFVKDLSRLGRDLARVIIVDNVADNFKLQSANGIFMKSWFEDMEDKCLSETAELLKDIAACRISDVRIALRNYRDQVLRQMIKGVSNPSFKLFT
jgi:Dullard-like phosphatase family protein